MVRVEATCRGRLGSYTLGIHQEQGQGGRLGGDTWSPNVVCKKAAQYSGQKGAGGCCQWVWRWWAGWARQNRAEQAESTSWLGGEEGWKCLVASRAAVCQSSLTSDEWSCSCQPPGWHLARVQQMQPMPVYISPVRWSEETQDGTKWTEVHQLCSVPTQTVTCLSNISVWHWSYHVLHGS